MNFIPLTKQTKIKLSGMWYQLQLNILNINIIKVDKLYRALHMYQDVNIFSLLVMKNVKYIQI
jgi:hypothetical protein